MSHCAERVADITSRTAAFRVPLSLMVWGDYTPNSMNLQRPEYWEENAHLPKASLARAGERTPSVFPAALTDTYDQGDNECGDDWQGASREGYLACASHHWSTTAWACPQPSHSGLA